MKNSAKVTGRGTHSEHGRDDAGAAQLIGGVVASSGEDQSVSEDANRGRRDSSLAHLRRATAIEPWASGSWLLLARALDAASDTAQTIAAFQRYIALAPRNYAARLLATRRIEQLGGGGPPRP